MKYKHRIGLPQWGLTCFYDSLVLNQSALLLLNFSVKYSPLRQAVNRAPHSFAHQADWQNYYTCKLRLRFVTSPIRRHVMCKFNDNIQMKIIVLLFLNNFLIGQSIVNGITAPIQLDSLLFVLPLISLSLMLKLIVKAIKDNSYTFRYSHGPPLYKQFESYRY